LPELSNSKPSKLPSGTLEIGVRFLSVSGPGRFEVPNWDSVSQKKIRDAVLVLAGTLPDTKRMFGRRSDVDPVRHLIGAATGWGENPEKEATYLTVVPNNGSTIHRLSVKDVPVDGFWSITVYNSEGYLQKNEYDAYSLNNITAHKSADGTVAVQFGGCDGKVLKLPADYAGLELLGAALSPARRNPERHVEIPGGTGGELNWLRNRSPRAKASRECLLFGPKQPTCSARPLKERHLADALAGGPPYDTLQTCFGYWRFTNWG
jgi:hypothetical protein